MYIYTYYVVSPISMKAVFKIVVVYMYVCTLSTYIIYLCVYKQLTHSIKLKVSNFYKTITWQLLMF